MGVSAEALDLVHRHPLLWAAVQDLSVPAWKARKVARSTHALSRQAAAHVDRRLAGRVASAGAAQIERVLAQAIATYHPEEHARRESRGKESWDVKLVHPPAEEFAGTSDLHARPPSRRAPGPQGRRPGPARRARRGSAGSEARSSTRTWQPSNISSGCAEATWSWAARSAETSVPSGRRARVATKSTSLRPGTHSPKPTPPRR